MDHSAPVSFLARTFPLAFAALLAAAPSARAQTAPAANPDTNSNAPAGKKEEIVELTPFDVVTNRDTSYGALNSNSITGFNVSLEKLPLSADILTSDFLKDTGTTTVEDAIKFVAGAGYAGSDPSTTAGYQSGDIVSNAFIQLRGLQTPVMQRDGFMPVGSYGNPGSTGIGYTSDFDIDRVEVINGPQGLLYGGGGAGGVVNMVSKQARLGMPAFGSVSYLDDQYGTKRGVLDFGASTKYLAFRFALMQGDQAYQRVNLGGPLNGQYGQIAFKAGPRTVIRITGERTHYRRSAQISPGVSTDNLSGAAFDRNGYNIYYLLATGMAGAADPMTGAAYPSGALDNGHMNFDNVDSYSGWWVGDNTTNAFGEITAESTWTPWLSTFVGAGYDNYKDQRPYATPSIYSPLNTSNPIPGQWAEGLNPLVYNSPDRTKAIRVAALLTTDLFGGLFRVHSQTLAGFDFTRYEHRQDTYAWYQADSNFNPVLTTSTSNNGRIALPVQYFNISNGPVFDALFSPYQTDVTVGGVNYVKRIVNQVDPSLVSPLDPLGVTLGGSTYQESKLFNRGIYGVNYSTWLGGKLDTLAGFRFADSHAETLTAGSKPSALSPSPHDDLIASKKVVSFNLGADYSVTQLIHPYVSFSNSYQPPPVSAADPYGNPPQTAHGVGEEAGLKIDNASGTLSGTLSAYQDDSVNEEYLMNGTLLNDISPKGVSTGGQHFNGGNQWLDVHRTSRGVSLALTAAPTSNWRMRFSASYLDGTIHSSASFAQLWDDDFYTNAAGQVTFSDGSVVWVPNSPSSKNPVVAPGTANAQPLTVATINNPGSPYFAFTSGTVPVAVQITNKSLTNVLNYVSTNGAVASPGSTIYTGIGGIPWQKSPILPAFAALGYSVPGTVVVAKSGDKTLGYPVWSANFTNVYTFASGWIKGLRVGGTVSFGWEQRGYYYFPSGVTPTAPRSLYILPNASRFDLIVGYARKFGRFEWSTQLNIDNLFNHYEIFLLPGVNTGYTSLSGMGASQWGRPRYYEWSTSLAF